MVEAVDSMVKVPGGEVFVRRWGGGERSPLVLFHDSLGSVELWRDFPEALAKAIQRPVIAYDRLGFGKSTRRVEPPPVDFVAEEARIYFPAIRSGLGIERFSLFGHSVGGAMAVIVAALSGDACEAVITESAQAFVEPRTLEGITVAKKQFADPEQLKKLARWHGDKAPWVLDAWTETWLSPPFRSWSLEEYLGRVTCPVLAIHGDRDEYGTVEFPRRIAAGVSGPSQLAILEDCGHVPHRERRDEIVELAASFLRGHGLQ